MRGFATGGDLCPLENKILKIGPQVSVWRTAAASARFPRPWDAGYVRFFWHGHSTYLYTPSQKEILKVGQLGRLQWPAAQDADYVR